MKNSEIADLAKQITYHNKKYWIEHTPEISDTEYDQLVETLRRACPFHPVLESLEEDSNGGKIKHEVPMLSLDKVFTADDIEKWSGNLSLGLVTSYKVDGLSCSLLYENGQLIRAATRGNGKEGDDVTLNVKQIEDIPHFIQSKKKLEVRGEVYMSRASFKKNLEDFEKLVYQGKAKVEDKPANARNFCAGSLKQKDASITKQRKLSFMAHNAVLYEDSPIKTECGIMEALKKLGFNTPYIKVINSRKDLDETISIVSSQREKLLYDTDGIVFCLNDLLEHKKLGSTSHHPRYRIAFKFGRERGETTVKGINWETSRTGRVVPTIELNPIFLGGAKVTYCTGHNAKNILDKKIREGCKVLMEREVIPYLVDVLTSNSNVKLISKCPSCNSDLEWDETETDLVCPNTASCPAQLVSYIQHYVSKKVVNILGVGDELIEKLIQTGLIKSPADLYKLTPDILINKLERQGDDSSNKIVDSIQSKRQQSLATFLYSLGIPRLGDTVSEKVAESFKSLEAILKANKEDFIGIEKIGDKMAEAIYNGLKFRKKLIEDLLKYIEIKKDDPKTGPLLGKTFCITGHVEFDYNNKNYVSRSDIENLIKSLGGTLKSVSKGLDYLIAGDEAGSKLEKAKKASIKIINSSEFLKLIEK